MRWGIESKEMMERIGTSVSAVSWFALGGRKKPDRLDSAVIETGEVHRRVSGCNPVKPHADLSLMMSTI